MVRKARVQDAELKGIRESSIERRLVKRDAFLAVGADCPAAYPAPTQATISERVLACLEPSGTAPVSTRELRSAVPKLSKLVIDRAGLALRSHRRVFLSQRRVPLRKEWSW